METFASEENEEARKFGEFYIDLLENQINLVRYYLSENAVLDWFGQTVKGEKNIHTFLKQTLENCKHVFPTASPVNSIGFRDTHIIKMPPEQKGQNKTLPMCQDLTGEFTPPNSAMFTSYPGTSRVEQGQGDGFHNCDSLQLPIKKSRFESKSELGNVPMEQVNGKEVEDNVTVKYISTEGSMEFRRVSSKKFQPETKWNRPCKLQVAYSSNKYSECQIYLIIYEGNMKCRRNLMKEFDALVPQD